MLMGPQFFKALRAELTAHGRFDILKRVVSYRGGKNMAEYCEIFKLTLVA